MTATGRTSVSEQALTLTREALDGFDRVPLSATIRTCLRIARMRGDWWNVWWLDMETIDINKRDAKARKAEMAGYFSAEALDSVHGAVLQEYMNARRMSGPAGEEQGQDKVVGWSVEQMEAQRANFEQQLNLAVPPEGMHQQDLYFADKKYDDRRSELGLYISEYDNVLSRIRRRVWDLLVRTEQQLGYGEIGADVFEQYRRYVDGRIGAIAPEALDQFRAAYRRAAEGEPEARAQAVLSCRRILKSLADALYPARREPIIDVDGREHVLTDDKWANRLWQYTAERQGSSRSRQLLQASLEDLGHRIDALNDLTSKGLHETTSPYEVQQAVIQTYVVVGDLLRLEQETAAAASPLAAE